MPRYFFNLHGDEDHLDDEGTELAGIRELRAFMAVKAADILIDKRNSDYAWQLEALDTNGRIIATITFSILSHRTF